MNLGVRLIRGVPSRHKAFVKIAAGAIGIVSSRRQYDGALFAHRLVVGGRLPARREAKPRHLLDNRRLVVRRQRRLQPRGLRVAVDPGFGYHVDKTKDAGLREEQVDRGGEREEGADGRVHVAAVDAGGGQRARGRADICGWVGI